MSQEDETRYYRAAHAVQSGVKILHDRGDSATHPKHLRVGVNSALVETGLLVKILTDKGLLTVDEWWKMLADAMEVEAAKYESLVSAALGRPVTLL